MQYNYDESDPLSILEYALTFKDKTFHNLISEHFEKVSTQNDLLDLKVKEDSSEYYLSENAKGQVGNILEKYGFGYQLNSNQEADFPIAGVELKQTCIDIKKNGQFTAGERLSITNISYKEEVVDNFYQSHVWEKIKLILLIHYIRDKSINRLDNVIKFVNLFTPPVEDLKIIIEDYNFIISKIKDGNAHELSESDTLYLGACTKGATAEKSLQPQFYSETKAKKRNFCFKRSYMNYILEEYVLKNNVPYKLPKEAGYRYGSDLLDKRMLSKKKVKNTPESIITDVNSLDSTSFECLILDKINRNHGIDVMNISKKYSCDISLQSKNFYSLLTFRMLGIKSNRATEFIKANIEVKTIRIQSNGKIKESMSFPTFSFNDLINQEWEESYLYNNLSETKFLFVVFKEIANSYVLDKAFFWNMPYGILDNEVRNCWIKTKQCLLNGVEFTITDKNGKITVHNNLPGMKDNGIVHVRPHSAKSAYKLSDGFQHGDIEKDADILPNGEWMTKQCFWLNNSFLLNLIEGVR